MASSTDDTSGGLKFCKVSWMLKLCFTAILFGGESEPDFSKSWEREKDTKIT